MNPTARILLLTGLFLLVGCDALEQFAGSDTVTSVVRDNPVDPGSPYPLVFGLADDQAVVGTVRPSFVFEFGPSVSSYTLQIAMNETFSGPLACEESAISESRHRVASTLSNKGFYYWRVKPRYKNGQDGLWSSTKTLQVLLPVPSGLAPNSGDLLNSPIPLLSWSPLGNGIRSEVQLSSNSDFSADFQSLSSGSSAATPEMPLVDGTKYYWRVRAVDSGVAGDWSPSSDFTILMVPPELLGPLENEWVFTPVFRWNTFPWGPNRDGFEIEISDSTGFDDTSTRHLLSTEGFLSFTDELVALRQYYWRVRGTYGPGFRGPWSVVRPFFRSPLDRFLAPEISVNSWLGLSPDNSLRAASTYKTGVTALSSEGRTLWSRTGDYGPVVIDADGRTYGFATTGPNPENKSGIVCVQPDGTEVWRFSGAAGEELTALALSADSQTLYFMGTGSEHVFYALSTSGTLRWSYSTGSLYRTDYYGRMVPLVTSVGRIAFFAGPNLYLLQGDGSLVWKTDLDGRPVWMVPGRGGRLYTYDDSGDKLKAVSAEGAVLWQISGGYYYHEPAVDSQGTLYLASGRKDRYQAIREDGTLKWEVPNSYMSLGQTVLGSDGILYFNQFVGGSDFKILARRTSDGALLWQCPLARGAWGFLMDHTGSLLASTGGGIAVVKTSSPGLDEAALWPMPAHDPQGTRNAAF